LSTFFFQFVQEVYTSMANNYL